MIKRALLAVLGPIAFCYSLPAQQPLDAPSTLTLLEQQIFNNLDSLDFIHQLPMLALLDSQFLPISRNLGLLGLAPVKLSGDERLASAADVKKPTTPSPTRANGKNSATDGKDSPGQVLTATSPSIYYRGEAGVFYGHSSGKFGGDEFGTYVIGTAGTDKFQITAGAAYQEWNGHGVQLRGPSPRRQY